MAAPLAGRLLGPWLILGGMNGSHYIGAALVFAGVGGTGDGVYGHYSNRELLSSHSPSG